MVLMVDSIPGMASLGVVILVHLAVDFPRVADCIGSGLDENVAGVRTGAILWFSADS